MALESTKAKAARPFILVFKVRCALGWHAGSEDPVRVLRKIHDILEKVLEHHDHWLRLQYKAAPASIPPTIDRLVVPHEVSF